MTNRDVAQTNSEGQATQGPIDVLVHVRGAQSVPAQNLRVAPTLLVWEDSGEIRLT